MGMLAVAPSPLAGLGYGAMDGHQFRSFSLMHGLCLLACALLVAIYFWLAKRYRDGPHASKRLCYATGVGCIVAWLANTAFWATRQPFLWEQAIPLHYCNMANLIGAVAILGSKRLFQALLYYWTFALSIWAFLTPTVRMGPLHVEFWIFWIYHLFVGLGVTYVLVADRFRPSLRDLWRTMGITAVYSLFVAVIDLIFGWNYGFIGPSEPESKTLIDALGPYPLRLLWMALLAAALFVLLQLPWQRRPEKHQEATPSR